MLIKKWKEFCEVRPQAQRIIFNNLTTFMFHFSAPFLPVPSFIKTDMERIVSGVCETSFERFVLKTKGNNKVK